MQLCQIPSLCSDSVAQTIVDKYLDVLNYEIHGVAHDSGCAQGPNILSKPKSWWCPELSLLGQRKQFWYNLWSECGKPKGRSSI